MKTLWLCFLGSFLMNCSTMLSGKNYEIIKVKTHPSGAEIYLDENYVGTSPLEIQVRRSSLERHRLRASIDGYHSSSANLMKTLNANTFWNAVFISTSSGVTSLGVDFLSGQMFRYSPTGYFLELKRDGVAVSSEHWIQIVRFTTENMEILRTEIATGDGPYLDAFRALLRKPADKDAYRLALDRESNELLALSDAVDLAKMMILLAD